LVVLWVKSDSVLRKVYTWQHCPLSSCPGEAVAVIVLSVPFIYVVLLYKLVCNTVLCPFLPNMSLSHTHICTCIHIQISINGQAA
jgi:hypothetical protein